MSTALITGASRGFGRALAHELAKRGWRLVLTARTEPDLAELGRALPDAMTVCGDVGSAAHREALAAAARAPGPLDLLVNNASELGPSPLPPLARYPIAELRTVLETNVLAPLALTQLLLPALTAANGVVVNLSSDAAIEAYPGWGGYGSSKAALDQLSAVLGAEEEGVRVYAFDPGDMRTQMHQRAFPGEDISDRPPPETVVPALLALLEHRPPSGRYRAAQFAPQAVIR
jgi:NAD(P)-dependent dehydrogenase (short-subunit alcohol dehydrogenase family)